MKRLIFLFTAAVIGLGSTVMRAQTPPRLTSITFLNGGGQPINCTSGGTVAVQLLFNKAMKNSPKPFIKYGLKGGTYNLNIPSTGNWQDTTLFQVVFNVNANVPSGPDGEYSFLVFGARDSANNVPMDSTYSDSLNTTLRVYRNGNMVSNKDTVNFGTIRLGKSKNDSVTITNSGCNNVTINSVALVPSPHFALLNNPAGVLQRDSSIVAFLRYQPTSRQSHQTRLRVIFTFNTKRDTTEIVLRGRAQGPRIAFVPPGNISFGVISVGSSFTKYVLVTNPRAPEPGLSDTLRIANIVSSLPAIFQVQLPFPLKIAPADTDTVRVTFSPNAAIGYNANLTLTTNDSLLVNSTIPLTGTGNINQPPPPITQLNVNWAQYGYGYPGYTYGDTLYICLPNNVANVAFVRWKIITQNITPQTPSDYTGSGIPFVSGGTLCFKIPLRNIVTSGRNYCWIWLDGTNGASGFNSAFYSPLYYYVGAPLLVNLNISGAYWPGGFAYYTNGNLIPLCWNEQNGRSISEVRWKLVRTPAAPANAADTTNGGSSKLSVSDTTLSLSCDSLLLNKILLQQGYWYAYVWLLDKAGNSGHANAVSFGFKYDTTAPVRPGGVLARNIPALTWFANNSLRLRINLPQAARDAAAVRWKYKTPPVSNNDFNGSALLTRIVANGDTASYSVPFNSTVLCGDDTLYYWLADSSGNASFSRRDSTRYRFDMCPPTLTRVKSLINNVAPVGQAFNDRLLVLDPDAGVDTVWVNYRLGGASTDAPPLPAFRVGNTDTFQFTIPLAGVTRRGIEFRATARDQVTPAYNGANTGYGPTNGPNCYGYDGGYTNATAADHDTYWYPIRTRATGAGDFRIDANGNPVPLAVGDTTNSYQLFSIPYNLDNTNALNTLQDDLGAYDATQWRLFDYLPQNLPANPWAEGTNVRPFAPGRSYFIVSRKRNIVLDSGPGVTRRTVCPDTLTIYSGWNLIATPFNFPVHKRSLRLVNANRDTVSLWSFENQWTFTDVMDAWRGYAIYVVRGQNAPQGAPMQLIVQPVAVPGRIGKDSAPALAWQRGEWAVQIAARANNAQDNYNWAGVRNGAQAGYDALEMAEPPVIGGYVAVSFPRAEWQQPAEKFCTDYRANSDEDQVWEFEVATNQTQSNVRVSFDFLGDLPAGAKVYVIDEALGAVQDLNAKAEYIFRTGSQSIQKKLKLIIGGQEFAAKEAGKIALVPEKFEVLQNYPNPFNPETSIRYNLSQSAPVRVEIFDQLGRRVRILVNGETQQAGYQNVLWDGRDDAGRGVASGIYIYKVTAGRESIAKKMVLQK